MRRAPMPRVGRRCTSPWHERPPSPVRASTRLSAPIVFQRTEWKGTDLLPSRDLLVVPDPRREGLATGLGRDIRGLTDEERTRNAGALRVKLGDKVCGNVVRGVAETRLRCEDDAVGELGVTDLDGLEESGKSGRHCEMRAEEDGVLNVLESSQWPYILSANSLFACCPSRRETKLLRVRRLHPAVSLPNCRRPSAEHIDIVLRGCHRQWS